MSVISALDTLIYTDQDLRILIPAWAKQRYASAKVAGGKVKEWRGRSEGMEREKWRNGEGEGAEEGVRVPYGSSIGILVHVLTNLIWETHHFA